MNRPRTDGELPPTAGLPLRWTDFAPGGTPLAEVIARQFNTPPMQLECSGTSALWVALRTLQLAHPQRRVVIVPAYTCPLVAIAVHALGLEVRLCDLRPNHYDMDPAQLAALCDANTLAVIPTHLGGRVADVATAVTIAHARGAFVIEDAAQALGAFSHGRSVGLLGDIALFSLAAGKGLSLYEGGLLLSANPDLRDALQKVSERETPRSTWWELRRCIELVGLAVCYRPGLLGVSYGNPLRRALADGQPETAVGDVFPLQIPRHRVSRWRQQVGSHAAQRLPQFLDEGRQRAAAWRQRLQPLRGMHIHHDAANDDGTWPVLMLQFDDPASRDAVLQRLWGAGLGVSRMFIHALPDYAYLRALVPAADVPNARHFAASMLTLGNSPWLDEARFDGIFNEIAQVLGQA